MLKVSLAICFCAHLMFGASAFSHADAFAIWGVMFMITAATVTIVGTARNGS